MFRALTTPDAQRAREQSRRMRQVFAIFKREFAAYFATPLAYVFIVIFLLAMGAFTFYVGHFYDNGIANLGVFFGYHPWLYLFLVPAVGMRLWAEERRLGTMELLLTLPIPIWASVLGKFLAAWAFTGVALALTFPIWITVNYLGNPDNGVIVGELCRQLPDGGRLSRDFGGDLGHDQQSGDRLRGQRRRVLPVHHFWRAAGAGFLPGLGARRAGQHDFLLQLPHPFPGHLVRRDRPSRSDLFRLADRAVPARQCRARRSEEGELDETPVSQKPTHSSPSRSAWCCSSPSTSSSNSWLGTARLDLTQNGLYTVSPGTKATLAKLQEPVTLRFYFSRQPASGYAQIVAYAQRVRDLLQEYASLADGKVRFEEIDPQPFTPAEDDAVAQGLTGAPTQEGDNVYFGLVGTNTLQGHEVIPFFDQSREEYLEYDLTSLVYKLSQPQKPKLGVISTLPLEAGAGGLQAALAGNSQPYVIYQQLQATTTTSRASIPQPPTGFPPMSRRCWSCIPPISATRCNMRSTSSSCAAATPSSLSIRCPKSSVQQGPGIQDQGDKSSSTLGPLLTAWGVDFDPTKVVGDAESRPTRPGERSEWPAAGARLYRLAAPDAGEFQHQRSGHGQSADDQYRQRRRTETASGRNHQIPAAADQLLHGRPAGFHSGAGDAESV